MRHGGINLGVGELMLCRRLLLPLLLLFLVSPVLAESVVILQGNKAYYAPTNSSAAVLVDRIIHLPNGGPILPPPPDPDSPSTLIRLSSTWVSKVTMYNKRLPHRQSLAAMYMLLGQQSLEGKFDDLEQLQLRTNQLKDILLGSDKPKWNEWGQGIGDYLSVNVSSLVEAGPAYAEIAAGLESSQEAIGPVILGIITFIIDALAEGDLDPRILALIKALLAIFGGG